MKAVIGVVCSFLLTSAAFAQHPAHSEVVAEMKAQLQAQGVDLSGPCGAWQITRAVAWRLQGEGVGLLSKPAGNNCLGYSVDFVTYQDGSGVDILSDAGGANGPGWNVSEPVGALLGRWRAPIPPTTLPEPVPPSVPAPPVFETTDLTQRLMRLENNQLIAAMKLDAITTTVQETHADVRELHGWGREAAVFIGKYILPAIGTALATWQVTKD